LRRISKSLRHTSLHLTPLSFARRKLVFFRNRPVFDSLPHHRALMTARRRAFGACSPKAPLSGGKPPPANIASSFHSSAAHDLPI
jgi:hypothetical protein